MNEGFGVALRRLRRASGLTQEQLAARAGLSARAVSDLERDPDRVPRLSTVALIVTALGLGPDDERHLLEAVGTPDGPMYAAGASTASAAVQVLPEPLTRLIGRESEREAIGHLLTVDDFRLVTLSGPGGVGKTRLAIAVARSLGSPAVFVDLAPVRDPHLVIPSIARELGVDDPSRLAAALATAPPLLVLDNLEQVVGAGPALIDLLTNSPALRILATSRVPLRVRGEREFRLAPLRLPSETGDGSTTDTAAYRLLLDRAQASGYEPQPTDAPVLAEICRRLGGLPLALELAAARLSVLDARGLLEALQTTLPALVDGPQDLPTRQRTMRDTISWSEDLLTPAARSAFHRMSVFATGGRLRDVVDVCAGDRAALDEVIRAGLATLRRGQDEIRLAMLEPVREYGVERLAATGDLDAVSLQHAEQTLATLRGPVRAEDLGNLRGALTWAMSLGSGDLAHRLAAAAVDHWIHLGALSEGQRFVARVRSSDEHARIDASLRLDVDLGALRLATALWDTANAQLLADDVVARAEDDGAPAQLVTALVARGMHLRGLNEYSAASDDYERAFDIATHHGDARGLLESVQALTYVRFYTGDMDSARLLAEKGRDLALALDDSVAGAQALLMLAWGDSHAGRFEQQVSRAEQAIAAIRESGHSGMLAEALRVLGDGLSYLPDLEGAVSAFEESRALYTARGEEHVAGQIDSQLAYVRYQLGALDQAEQLLESALATGRQHADRWAEAMCTTLLGHVALAQGNIALARGYLAEGQEHFEAIGNPLYVAWSFEGRAVLAAHDEDWAEVDELLKERERIRTELGSQLPPFDTARFTAVSAARAAGVGAPPPHPPTHPSPR